MVSWAGEIVVVTGTFIRCGGRSAASLRAVVVFCHALCRLLLRGFDENAVLVGLKGDTAFFPSYAAIHLAGRGVRSVNDKPKPELGHDGKIQVADDHHTAGLVFPQDDRTGPMQKNRLVPDLMDIHIRLKMYAMCC